MGIEREAELIAEVIKHKGYATLLERKVTEQEARITQLEGALAAQCEINGLLQGELGVKGELLHQRDSCIEQLEGALREVLYLTEEGLSTETRERYRALLTPEGGNQQGAPCIYCGKPVAGMEGVCAHDTCGPEGGKA